MLGSPGRIHPVHWWLLLGCGAAGLAGYFGPWVPHPAAGLVITGIDLAEYVQFLPEVASRQLPLVRELFYLPLFTTSLGAAILASRRGLPPGARILIGVGGVPLALAMLPPAWSPAVLRAPGLRLQVLAIALCLVALLAAPLLRRIGDGAILAPFALLALLSAAMPAWAFLQVRPLIAGLYRHALSLGWGFWLCLVGMAALGVASAVIAMAGRNGRHGSPAHG